MKDYSVNEEERKDFVLGFEETEDELYVNFAGEKEPWPLPNEEKNRQKLLDKMHDQVQNSGKFERNNILNKYVYMISTITCMLLAIFSSSSNSSFPQPGLLLASKDTYISFSFI